MLKNRNIEMISENFPCLGHHNPMGKCSHAQIHPYSLTVQENPDDVKSVILSSMRNYIIAVSVVIYISVTL